MQTSRATKAHAKFAPHVIEAISKALCEYSEFLSHSRIDRAFEALQLREINPSTTEYQKTKWIRVYDTLLGYQKRTGSGQCVVQFIEHCLNPAGYTTKPELFEQVRSDVNERLSFVGLRVSKQGKVEKGSVATTLDESARIADSMVTELRRRSAHPYVLKYCSRELIQKDLFHGVHEATKGVFERLRLATGVLGDGAELVDKTLGLNGGPMIAINRCVTESEKSVQKGFCNLLKGAAGIWRNRTAHELRLTSDLERQEVLDALATLSYIHRQLDNAVVTRTGERVP